jgi:phosphoserine phosphatase
VFFASDLHGSDVAFRKMLNAVKAYGVHVLICGGDIAGKRLYPVIHNPDGTLTVHINGHDERLRNEADVERARSLIANAGGYTVDVDPDAAAEIAADTNLMMQLVDWVRLDVPSPVSAEHARPRDRDHRCGIPGCGDRHDTGADNDSRRSLVDLDALLIDLDDTLLDADGSRAAAFAVVDGYAARTFGAVPGVIASQAQAVLDELWTGQPFVEDFGRLGYAKTDALWVEFRGPGELLSAIRAWMPEFRERYWRSLAERANAHQPIEPAALGELFIAERLARIRMFPGVDRVLAALRTRFPLVLITNGPDDLQRMKLRRTGLGAHFEVVVTSGEVGAAKPAVEIFEAALDAARAAPERALMVGDDWRRDVVGAHAAGIAAVLVATRTGHSSELRGRETIDGTPVIDRFVDLPELLGHVPERCRVGS